MTKKKPYNNFWHKEIWNKFKSFYQHKFVKTKGKSSIQHISKQFNTFIKFWNPLLCGNIAWNISIKAPFEQKKVILMSFFEAGRCCYKDVVTCLHTCLKLFGGGFFLTFKIVSLVSAFMNNFVWKLFHKRIFFLFLSFLYVIKTD